ncbi:MAG: hypothetical protein JRH08_17225 [Deltaproteobacteria bacterium]|nr:hypothetical protein [Deltaproteobacteria bacterium]MBW1930413.1 hypothetical protein [Deltaproteobacteria bacterium]MBW2127347.1 hypothetical protein [Deltaproteobacteria bacterium]
MNFLEDAVIKKEDDKLLVKTDSLRILIPDEKKNSLMPYLGKAVTLGIRPEDLSESDSLEDNRSFKALVEVVQPVGNQIFIDAKVGSHNMLADVSPQSLVKPRQEIILKARVENLHFFDPETQEAI